MVLHAYPPRMRVFLQKIHRLQKLRPSAANASGTKASAKAADLAPGGVGPWGRVVHAAAMQSCCVAYRVPAPRLQAWLRMPACLRHTPSTLLAAPCTPTGRKGKVLRAPKHQVVAAAASGLRQPVASPAPPGGWAFRRCMLLACSIAACRVPVQHSVWRELPSLASCLLACDKHQLAPARAMHLPGVTVKKPRVSKAAAAPAELPRPVAPPAPPVPAHIALAVLAGRMYLLPDLATTAAEAAAPTAAAAVRQRMADAIQQPWQGDKGCFCEHCSAATGWVVYAVSACRQVHTVWAFDGSPPAPRALSYAWHACAATSHSPALVRLSLSCLALSLRRSPRLRTPRPRARPAAPSVPSQAWCHGCWSTLLMRSGCARCCAALCRSCHPACHAFGTAHIRCGRAALLKYGLPPAGVVSLAFAGVLWLVMFTASLAGLMCGDCLSWCSQPAVYPDSVAVEPLSAAEVEAMVEQAAGTKFVEAAEVEKVRGWC